MLSGCEGPEQTTDLGAERYNVGLQILWGVKIAPNRALIHVHTMYYSSTRHESSSLTTVNGGFGFRTSLTRLSFLFLFSFVLVPIVSSLLSGITGPDY